MKTPNQSVNQANSYVGDGSLAMNHIIVGSSFIRVRSCLMLASVWVYMFALEKIKESTPDVVKLK